MRKYLLLLLIIPALACSTTLTKPMPAQLNDNILPTEQDLPSPTIATISTTRTATPQICEVIADALHVRDAPNVSGKVIAWLEHGDQLIILPTEPSGDWIQVQFESLTGWINSIYCERK